MSCLVFSFSFLDLRKYLIYFSILNHSISWQNIHRLLLATHKPIYYNAVIKDVSSHTKRLVQYSLTIFILSVLFNVPKFLEAWVEYFVIEKCKIGVLILR